MSLMRRPRTEMDWPDWFGSRRFPFSESWRELLEEPDLKVEEFKEDGELVVRAEMPGIDPDTDVDISMTDHTLHLRAERRTSSETEDKEGYRSEFHYGSFSRAIRLPPGATEEDVKATYVDGILEVRIPIDEAEAGAKKIPIGRG